MVCQQLILDAGHTLPRVHRPTQPRALLAGPCYLKSTGRRNLGVTCSVEGPGPERALVEEAAAAAVLKKPRFQPFNPHSLARQRMLEFQQLMCCGGGNMLLIQPLEAGLVKETAGILTESFAESMGYLSVYKTFLQRQIIQYLEHHTGLPPKTVVLVALLLTAEEWQALQQGRGHATQEEQAPRSSSAQGSSHMSNMAAIGSSLGGGSGACPPLDNENGSGQSSSSAGMQVGPLPAGPGSGAMAGRDGGSSRTGHHADAAEDLATIAGQQDQQQQGAAWQARPPEEQQQQQQQQQQEQAQPGPQPGLPASREVAPASALSQAFPRPASSNGGGPSGTFFQGVGASTWKVDEGIDGGAAEAAAEAAAAAREPSGAQAGAGSPPPGMVVGVVEVSFAASTRTKYLTLNPPEDRPYLCNMAVAPERRGRGYGTLLMRAAEELVTYMGERELYLHVRAQDELAARLYLKAGFSVLKEDNFFVVLLRQDRRLLMRKQLR